MSTNLVNKDTGELVTLANGTRMWIGTQSAHDLAVQQGTMPNNCMVCITDDYKNTMIGEMKIWCGASNAVPDGWLYCDGSAVSRVQYADLFAVIGTAFGSGDGSTTFNIPNMRGKTAMGVETGHDLGASENGALPNIKAHTESVRGGVGSIGVFAYTSGAFITSNSTNNGINGSDAPASTHTKLDFNASNYNSIYSDDQTKVDPANVRVNYIICYE